MATDAQVELLKHALGLNDAAKPFRNHFAANPDSDYDDAWAGLVREGLAELVRGSDEVFPSNWYRASARGVEVAKDDKHDEQSDGRRVPPGVQRAEAGEPDKPAEGTPRPSD